MPAISGQLLVPKYPGRHGEFSITAERMEEQGPKTVQGYWRQAHAEDALLAPLKVQATDVVVARERIGHHVAVVEAPGAVQLPGVDDQAVAELVRHVGERVVAAVFAQVHRDVRDEGVLRRFSFFF